MKIKLTKEYLIEKYINEKLSVKEISKRCHIYDELVYRLLRDYDIPIRNKREVGLLKLNLIGKRFGKLVVVNRDTTEYKDKTSRWNCLCDCGKNKVIRSRSLLSKGTKSCGCISRRGYEEIPSNYIRNIKIHAKKRNLTCDITPEEIWNLFVEQNRKCVLSGVNIQFGGRRKETTASLDRIDSSRGYTLDNVQWVHKDVNQMKSDRNVEDFLKWVNTIASYQSRTN